MHHLIGVTRLARGDAARALIYVQQAFAEEPATPRVPAGDIAALSLMEKNAKLTSTQAKTLLAELVANGGGDVLAMAKAKGFEAMATGALESIVDQAIAADPQAWARIPLERIAPTEWEGEIGAASPPPGTPLLRGQVHDVWGAPAVVSYDCVTLLRSPAEKAKAWADLCLAMAQLKPST